MKRASIATCEGGKHLSWDKNNFFWFRFSGYIQMKCINCLIHTTDIETFHFPFVIDSLPPCALCLFPNPPLPPLVEKGVPSLAYSAFPGPSHRAKIEIGHPKTRVWKSPVDDVMGRWCSRGHSMSLQGVDLGMCCVIPVDLLCSCTLGETVSEVSNFGACSGSWWVRGGVASADFMFFSSCCSD